MEPHVVEVGGSTDQAAWVPVDEAAQLTLSGAAQPRPVALLGDLAAGALVDEPSETVFTYGAPALKFGRGASDEIGFDLTTYDARRVLRRSPTRASPRPGTPAGSPSGSAARGIEVAVFDRVHVEPTDASLEEAVAWAREEGPWDAFVAVGGGSAIDTAKAVNLLTTNPGELMDYINAPVGRARAPRARRSSPWSRCRPPRAPAARAPPSACSTCSRST